MTDTNRRNRLNGPKTCNVEGVEFRIIRDESGHPALFEADHCRVVRGAGTYPWRVESVATGEFLLKKDRKIRSFANPHTAMKSAYGLMTAEQKAHAWSMKAFAAGILLRPL